MLSQVLPYAQTTVAYLNGSRPALYVNTLRPWKSGGEKPITFLKTVWMRLRMVPYKEITVMKIVVSPSQIHDLDDYEEGVILAGR